MDKVLFVVDMQEMYVGRGRDKTTYSYDADALIDAINKRISAYKAAGACQRHDKILHCLLRAK